MTNDPASTRFPDGIAARNLTGRGGVAWLPLAVLGALMLAAMLGAFGGGKSRALAAQGAAASLSVVTPRTIRNGEFFETRIRVEARQDLAKAVLVVPASLWRDMTINTMIPAPAEEKAERGSFRFDYGAMKSGDVLDIKIDGQINPPLFAGTRGTVALNDGERPVAGVPIAIRVLP